MVLRRVSTVQFPEVTGRFNPTQFLQTDLAVFFGSGPGLLVYKDFYEMIAVPDRDIDPFPAGEGACFDLIERAKDTAIRSELPPEHVFEDPSEFCSRLVSLLKRQEDSTPGDLKDTGGNVNIFYVRGSSGNVCQVTVNLSGPPLTWIIAAGLLDKEVLYTGFRIFSRGV
jgi:hypothetical protein